MCTTCGCSGDSAGRVTLVTSDAHHDDHDHGDHDHGDHDHHGHDHPTRTVTLEQDVLAKNDLLAARNRGWFEGRSILAVNLMSSPGAGKTTLLERTVRELGDGVTISVLEGDQETLLDAERIRDAGSPAVQINTGAGCHLDAEMLAKGLGVLDPPAHSLVFIENVGNLVCPALFDLGEQAKVVIVSVTEGDDKPLKYPHMLRVADLVLLNKVDLLPYVPFESERFLGALRRVNPDVVAVPLSATGGEGMSDWYAWLRERLPPKG